MQSTAQTAPVSKAGLGTGRIISTMAVLFLVVDGVTKLMKIAPVVEAFARLGYPESLAPVIGTILLVCVVVYVIPPTSILGAILLTAYLGGAVEVNLRVGDPLFETIFPIIFGVLIWAGVFLRDDRLCALIPLAKLGCDVDDNHRNAHEHGLMPRASLRDLSG